MCRSERKRILMHSFDDTGIIINVSRYGETSAVVRVLTAEHGLCAGMVKGAFAKQHRGTYQLGNRLHIHWQARLEEHLGQIRGELLQSVSAVLLTDVVALKVVNAACALVQVCMPERITNPMIYNYFDSLIAQLEAEPLALLSAYVQFELSVLQGLGFGLDFMNCASGENVSQEALVYVSPKSGRAVSREAGEPYKDKMLPLPAFLRDGAEVSPAKEMRQILDGMALTGYFLGVRLLQPEGKSLPEARQQLLEYIQK